MTTKERWRGLATLVVDAVTHGSEAVERIQKEVAGYPFWLLEQIPPLAPVTKLVHVAYDASVTGAHAAVRLVARAAGSGVGLALDLSEPTNPVDKA